MVEVEVGGGGQGVGGEREAADETIVDNPVYQGGHLDVRERVMMMVYHVINSELGYKQ